MSVTIRLIAALQLLAALAYGYDGDAYKDPHYADGRTTMVHLFEWKFSDIADECERFLGPMGYGGVQVSPIHENLILSGRPWYERYQPISYKIATRSGNEQQFKDMVDRCNAVGVRIYVDAVINHMTGDSLPAVGTGGSKADPKTLSYPAVPYGAEEFNKDCEISDYNNADQVRDCKLSGLHDLDQSKPAVRDRIVEFMNRVIDLGVAGFRIDAAKHMWPQDLEKIYGSLKDLRPETYGKNKKPFIFQEVIDLGGEAVKKNQYNYLSDVIDFVYGIVMGRSFRGMDPLSKFERWGTSDRGFLPSKDALVMVDNHDNQRGHGAGGASILNYKVPRDYKMAIAFMLAHPYGHPRVMSSFEFSDPSQGPPSDNNENLLSPEPVTNNVAAGQEANSCGHGWVCEHRWSPIYNMVGFRNNAKDAPVSNWWSNGNNQIAFSRGTRGFIAFNGHDDGDLKQNLQTGLPAGQYCDIISGRKANCKCTGKIVNVKADGTAEINIPKDDPQGAVAINNESKVC